MSNSNGHIIYPNKDEELKTANANLMRLQRKTLFNFQIHSCLRLLPVFLAALIFFEFAIPLAFNLALVVISFSIILVTIIDYRRFKHLNQTSFIARRLDSKLAALEHSSECLLTNMHGLGRLQQARISIKLNDLFKSSSIQEITRLVSPRPAANNYIFLLILQIITIFSAIYIQQYYVDKTAINIDKNSKESPVKVMTKSASKISWRLVIEPPAYTGLPTRIIQKPDQLVDLVVVENATLRWLVQSKKALYGLALMMGSEKSELDFKNSSPTDECTNFCYQLTSQANSTELIAINRTTQSNDLSAIAGQVTRVTDGLLQSAYVIRPFLLRVRTDKAPKLRWLQPQESSVSFSKNQLPQLTSRLIVEDDYGIDNVRLVATLAKGSGEAVKFRDLEIQFDSEKVQRKEKSLAKAKDKTKIQPGSRSIVTQGVSQQFEKAWDLKQLGMQPGDSLYFRAMANDNRQKRAQQGRSSTVIIKWLDSDEELALPEGLSVPYKPPYFKSQRQIIVDTESLIKRRRIISSQKLAAESAELGHAQQALKLKFGEYLGDENESGLAHDISTDHSTEATGTDSEHGQDNNVSSASEHEHGHGEHEMEQSAFNSAGSAKENLIQAFGHQHGTTEIGPLSAKDPKSWMKSAVAAMWQAELHLMLAQPEKALPFEYDAYHALKLARAAEKIYVKRLGFEPPPVSEDSRLSGELGDIPVARFSKDNEKSKTVNPKTNGTLALRLQKLITHFDPSANVLGSKTPAADEKQMLGQLIAEFLQYNKQKGVEYYSYDTINDLQQLINSGALAGEKSRQPNVDSSADIEQNSQRHWVVTPSMTPEFKIYQLLLRLKRDDAVQIARRQSNAIDWLLDIKSGKLITNESGEQNNRASVKRESR